MATVPKSHERPRQHRRAAPRPQRVGKLPSLVASTRATPILTRLPPREQEIATIVYLHTDVTAKDLEYALSGEITNSAIRCMLGRLVAKGVLRRRKGGKGKTLIYSPAIVLHDVQERALERLAGDYFGGSLDDTLNCLTGLVRKRRFDAFGNARFEEFATKRAASGH